MSWHFSQALVEEYLAANCSGGAQSAPLKSTPMPLAYLCSDRMTAFLTRSLSGMTFEPLMEHLGAVALTWFLAGFHAKGTAQPQGGALWQKISGRKCGESWQMSLPATSLPRTPKEEQSIRRQTTSSRWVTKPAQLPFRRQTWVLTTYGKDIGYLHTPTTMANYAAPSMQKHECCRSFVKVFGRPTPANQEWLMQWPVGWTDLKPLAMGNCPPLLRLHGRS